MKTLKLLDRTVGVLAAVSAAPGIATLHIVGSALSVVRGLDPENEQIEMTAKMINGVAHVAAMSLGDIIRLGLVGASYDTSALKRNYRESVMAICASLAPDMDCAAIISAYERNLDVKGPPLAHLVSEAKRGLADTLTRVGNAANGISGLN